MSTRRTLVLVAGSGRSGTSLFAGVLQRLGFYVPQPEVPADDTNPRGFGESQWVVDFHADLLQRARVQVADSRPAAWALTAEAGFDVEVQKTLRQWLDRQFEAADDVIIKDPRLSWFLPLWRRCGDDVGAAPRFVTMVRHPAAVLNSKQRSYGTWQSDVSRAAGWVNQTVFTERATRDAPRAFVRYEDLLDDWTQTIDELGGRLDLAAIRDAPAPAMRRVHDFVDKTLSRSSADWGDMRIPAPLRDLADDVWDLMESLATGGERSLTDRLDGVRSSYIELYEQAEAIAQSSVVASRRPSRSPVPGLPRPAATLMRRVPRRYRHRIPLHWRKRIVKAFASR